MYDVKVLQDSINTSQDRLTTLEITFPRFLLGEFNTHRMFSRNSASSRAIPPEKQIERVKKNPFVPVFNQRVKGMGVGEQLETDEQTKCVHAWMESLFTAIDSAQAMIDANADKSRINRILEPFLWHTAIVSATDWENFLALRDHESAQPEMQTIASMIRSALEQNIPIHVQEGFWHTPLVEHDALRDEFEQKDEFENLEDQYKWAIMKHVSAGRCARVSFDTHENFESPERSVERSNDLIKSGHFSPFEHVARPFTQREWDVARSLREEYINSCVALGQTPDDSYAESFFYRGNFRGWVQMRKEIQHEGRFDLAIGQKTDA